jgi:lysozyme
MTRPVPACTYDFLRQREGLKLIASADVGGTMDAGYGHDDATLKPGQAITQAQAELWLKQDVAVAAGRLAKVVDEAVILSLTDNQYAALLSFVFNLGCDPSWTLWKVLNARDYDHVPEQMMRFVYCKGAKVQGLVNRRAAEVQLWSMAEPGSVPDDPSSAVTRTEATPPLPAKTDITHIITAATAAVGAVPVAAKTVSDAVTPYADKSPLVAHMVAILATVAAVATVVLLGLGWLKNRRANT